MSLKAQITDDMKTAMREKNTEKLGTIRLLLAAIKQKEVDERIELTDTDIITIIDKMLKQRKDSIQQYQAAGRDDLAAVEQAETLILQAYMPTQLSDAEINAAIAAVIAEQSATGMSAMGKVVAALKAQLAGKADMAVVSAKVKAALTA